MIVAQCDDYGLVRSLFGGDWRSMLAPKDSQHPPRRSQKGANEPNSTELAILAPQSETSACYTGAERLRCLALGRQDGPIRVELGIFQRKIVFRRGALSHF